MIPTYEIIKQFTEWLKKVRPDFEIESDKYYITPKVREAHYTNIETLAYVVSKDIIDKGYYQIDLKNGYKQTETLNGYYVFRIVTTDALHAILWELFDIENPLILKYSLEMLDGDNSVEQLNYIRGKKWKTPDCFADELWKKYTSHKESMWIINPDKCLKDIMKIYDSLR